MVALALLHKQWLRRSRLLLLAGLLVTFSLLILSSRSSALIDDLPIIGSKRCDRRKGKPTVYTDIFKTKGAHRNYGVFF